MLTRIFLFLFFILFSPHLFALDSSLKVFEAANGKYGFKNPQGQIAIPAQFDFAYEFNSCGIAAVTDKSGWRYINVKNETVIVPFVFDNGPDYFSEGLARFVQDGKIGFSDACGKIVIPAQFDFATAFEKGRAQICTGCEKSREGEHTKWVGGKWYEINVRGERI